MLTLVRQMFPLLVFGIIWYCNILYYLGDGKGVHAIGVETEQKLIRQCCYDCWGVVYLQII
jgi:hypothetical protein